MPLITNQIPNLINGVSQQSPSLRLATQAEEQINGYSTVANGLKKRPPRIFKGKLNTTFPDTAFIHTMDRSETERYQLFISGGDLKVFDLFTGAAKTVTFPNGKGYLAGANPKTTFRAKTVADYTFITNNAIVPAMGATIQPNQTPRALVFVKAGNYARWYRIFINGTEVANYQTATGGSGADAYTVSSEQIVAALTTGAQIGGIGNPTTLHLSANLPANFTFNTYGPVIQIWTTNNADFSIRVEDGYSGNAMTVIKDEVALFTDLPPNAPIGFQTKIYGSEKNSSDNYYVTFQKPDGDSGVGVWRESPAPGTPIAFNPATMPHVLISNADGTFTFKEATWDNRVAGDDTILPHPTFIGEPISDISFHRNRLVFLSGENVIMSRAGDFFNFWRTTANELLDDDPIDVPVTNDKVSTLNFPVPWLGSLFLFSDTSQFALTADKLLTPKTISMDPVSEFDASSKAPPVTVGTYTYFPVQKGNFSDIQEYFLSDNVNNLYDANPITNHVPSYVPSDVFRLIASSTEAIIVGLTEKVRNSIWVYKYYWSDGKKLQSSWSKWVFEAGTTVLWADLINDILYLTVRYSDGTVAFEQMPLEVSYVDTGITWAYLLDRRLTQAQMTLSYNATTKLTTYTLPYSLAAGEAVEVYTSAGAKLTVTSATGNTVTVKGNQTGVNVYLGTPYSLSYVFSEFFNRSANGSGGTDVHAGGRLQLHHLALTYADSTYFRVEVTPRGRQTYSYSFEGRRSGEAGNQIGVIPIANGTFKVPLFTTSEGLKVEIINDSAFSSNILSAEWRAQYVPRRIN